jgi:geranyl-CoA carboxylase beta subunit
MVGASDSAIKGGSIAPMGLRRACAPRRSPSKTSSPLITLVESAGANLLYQSEIFVDGGRVFANMARLSAAGIPQITVVHGSSTAGGAYLPGLSDYVIAVRGQAKVFLAGPPLVKAAIGEDADDEALGGAELHATVTGTAEYIAENDAHAIHLARQSWPTSPTGRPFTAVQRAGRPAPHAPAAPRHRRAARHRPPRLQEALRLPAR